MPARTVRVIDRDRGFNALKLRIAKAKIRAVTVGVHEELGSQQHDPDTPITIAEIAAFHEFGTDVIPERSYLRATVDEKQPEIWLVMRALGRRILSNSVRMDPVDALKILGLKIQSLVQQRIRDRIPPALEPATIRRKTVQGKKGDVPLIDTGQLIQSITFEIK